jgi:hypothetical protein
LNKEFSIREIQRSKRLVTFVPTIERGLAWLERNATGSLADICEEDLELLEDFPESFL